MLAGGVAHGGGRGSGATRTVHVESEPSGATVYLNVKEDGPVCPETPCDIQAPVGTTPIILELAGHETVLEELVVGKKDKGKTVSYALAATVGTIVVTGPRGATIRIDDEEKGEAPSRVPVDAGTHVVVLLLNGKEISSDAVDVPADGEAEVSGPRGTGGGVGEGVGVGEGEGEGVPGLVAVVPKPPTAPRAAPILAATLAMDIGFRSFTYQDPMTANLRSEKEGGQVLVGPAIEFFPGTLAGVHALRGLAVTFHYGYGANSQQVGTAGAGGGLAAKTYWSALSFGLRQRWVLGGKGTLEVGAGYVREQYRFSGDNMDILLLPDAQYGSVRIGVRLSALLGRLEPYLVGENRIVTSGGILESRFDKADASGLHAALGVVVHLGPHLGAIAQGGITRYAWTFQSLSSMATYQASGATDSIKLVTLGLGYTY